jgi:hypothetical protein
MPNGCPNDGGKVVTDIKTSQHMRCKDTQVVHAVIMFEDDDDNDYLLSFGDADVDGVVAHGQLIALPAWQLDDVEDVAA